MKQSYKIYVPDEIEIHDGIIGYKSREQLHELIRKKAIEFGLLTVTYLTTIDVTRQASYVLFTGNGNWSWSTEQETFDSWEAININWYDFLKLNSCNISTMKPRYYIKKLTDDGRLVEIKNVWSPCGFPTFDDAINFLDRHDIHGAVIITVIERVR